MSKLIYLFKAIKYAALEYVLVADDLPNNDINESMNSGPIEVPRGRYFSWKRRSRVLVLVLVVAIIKLLLLLLFKKKLPSL